VSEALIYTVQRLALFAVSLLVFALLGAGPVLAVVLAALVSAGLSYVLLRRRRDAVAASLAERLQQRAAARAAGPTDADTAAEDAAADQVLAHQVPPERPGAAEPSRAPEPSRADERSAGGERESQPEQ
jgi:hypothetical protein